MELLSKANPPEHIAAQTAAIHQAVLKRSQSIREANFTRIGTDDLEFIFDQYDKRFLNGWMRQHLGAENAGLVFRLSSRMTRSGGRTSKYTSTDGRPPRYEIAVATLLLFMTFGGVRRPVEVVGLACQDRLDALQRIMEHEIIHLMELLAWGRSSCSAKRFRTLASNFFGHRGSTHNLVTTQEHAATVHGVKPGDEVEFDYEGKREVGRVNRIIGRKVEVVFSDGEKLSGTTSTYTRTGPGFYVSPVDPQSNNQRIYVVNKNVRSVRLL